MQHIGSWRKFTCLRWENAKFCLSDPFKGIIWHNIHNTHEQQDHLHKFSSNLKTLKGTMLEIKSKQFVLWKSTDFFSSVSRNQANILRWYIKNAIVTVFYIILFWFILVYAILAKCKCHCNHFTFELDKVMIFHNIFHFFFFTKMIYYQYIDIIGDL